MIYIAVITIVLVLVEIHRMKGSEVMDGELAILGKVVMPIIVLLTVFAAGFLICNEAMKSKSEAACTEELADLFGNKCEEEL